MNVFLKALWVLGMITFTTMLAGQSVVDNPAKPAAKNAGRTVALEEIVTVRDGGEAFYFEWPRHIQAAPDGSFFLVCQNQLLQFDTSGRFLRNYYKQGQGPGEMQYAASYGFDGRTLIAFSFPKVLRFELDGRYLGEYRINPKAGSVNFLDAYGGRCLFVKYAFPAGKVESEVVDMPQVLVLVSGNGENIRELSSFPIKAFVMRGERGGGAMDYLNRLLTASVGDGRMFISHTQEYLVKLYDSGSDRVLRTFCREYDRVPLTPEEKGKRKKPIAFVGPNKKPVIPPPQKYSNDIRDLYVVGDRLWILTSAFDPEKGKLVDIFDFEGRYLDAFYLPLPKNLAPEGYDPLCIIDGRIYAIELNPDETAVLRVFRISDPGIK
ncbi:MAG: 6-bladed beta-propeller [Candidatus Aminicenantes bacterium]|nr:6-bladed beta-propeller [Candidatus Aminicenantes bacterium]